ncbi:MAG: hypothetical protein ACK40G_12890 [Cytophagaceae bacterium]
MTELERELYKELTRTIKLLGGKSDIVGTLNILTSQLPEREAVEEVFTLVKCWNDNMVNHIDHIPENELYKMATENPCNMEWGE